MTREEAIAYCWKHRNAFIGEMSEDADGVEMFDCLLSGLEDGNIKPSELKDYGMDFG